MITTKRLTIRPIEENDWTAIKEILDMLASSHESDKSEFVRNRNFEFLEQDIL